MEFNRDMEQYIQQSLPELEQLIYALCRIPAPSHHEEARARFCRDWFRANGAPEAYIDDALNVVCPDCAGTGDLAVFMAHTDTVFPDLEPMPFRREGDRMYCPGVTDDTASLAVMMICARRVFQTRPRARMGLLFAANSCEEGLGNLKGCRQIMADYGERVRELITLDGTELHTIVTDAVGSHRYRISVRTEGGHSFADFGKPNAIAQLSEIVRALYSVPVPAVSGSVTTYNVGQVSGGTSVNTIAQYAEMLYEYRSNNRACMAQMEETLTHVLRRFRGMGVDVAAERIGDRPCSACPDSADQKALAGRAADSVRRVTGGEPCFVTGSTDANIPLAAGIPAICISVCNGGKCHTREEWLDVSSLRDGCRLFMDILQGYME